MRHNQGGTNYLLFIALLLIFGSVSLANDTGPSKADSPFFQPGKETLLTFEEHKLVLYLPLDYNDINAAPVIFFYHGQGGHPSTDFFQHVTGSKGFVIVGMSYADEPEGEVLRGQVLNYLKIEFRRLARLKIHLKRELNVRIDEKKLFVSGISKGGWFTSDLLDYNPRPWAGAVIIAAGRREITQETNPKNLKGKPIYIGAGETDTNRHSAERAQAFYRRCGAEVTFEIYEGLGHSAKADSVRLQQWLADRIKTTDTDSQDSAD
ncbi:MAG: dienelactone hydrolase family protein [Sedimentisphaerales bacterium]|nr:dienelactone hydrolase family protein [Sedimentisphaerales bacterium]